MKQREIKFRCWDKKRCIMREPSGCEHDIVKGELIIGETFEYGTHDEFIHFEIMQFTGLQDKNGKDIYEGDIVTADHCGVQPVVYNLPYNAAFCVGAWLLGVIDFTDIEIIGNIYESPQLLNSEPNHERSVATKLNQGTDDGQQKLKP